ncbi:TnsA-like heteromeric transposase endonuclease subunit [Frondihabitans australicus]|uniref:TnsA endonuclease-like protein n=1 Tax=Frondihabitans australicus TaxID=386892 RepID=A0A495IIS8_9MICO|nr:TnsA-like heteromeric transposase endonuclease subunit [Frondihabitans australicus]RKR75894.1 hypothetical protein C8E83_3058 [Frondihabitans australicus]
MATRFPDLVESPLPDPKATPASALGGRAPIGIPPRNKKPFTFPLVPIADLRREPWVQFRPSKNVIRTLPLAELLADDLRGAFPAREPKNHKDRLSTSGAYWSATAKDLVFYESLIERETILLSDFDPDVVELIAQPFRLLGIFDGRRRIHTPDYAQITIAGGIRVKNCKPFDKVSEAKNVALHGWVDSLLGQAGISHEVVVEMPSNRARNMSSIAHLRNDRWIRGLPLDAVVDACRGPMRVAELVASCSSVMTTATALACLRALLWRRAIEADLDDLLSMQSVVWPARA